MAGITSSDDIYSSTLFPGTCRRSSLLSTGPGFPMLLIFAHVLYIELELWRRISSRLAPSSGPQRRSMAPVTTWCCGLVLWLCRRRNSKFENQKEDGWRMPGEVHRYCGSSEPPIVTARYQWKRAPKLGTEPIDDLRFDDSRPLTSMMSSPTTVFKQRKGDRRRRAEKRSSLPDRKIRARQCLP